MEKPQIDHKKLKIAYHETGHAVMALICRQGVKCISLKEMDSPIGTDRYLGFTKLEPFEQTSVITINEATRRVMISLGGYASEIVLLDGSAMIGGDDLTTAIKWVNTMMLSDDFKRLAEKLPLPAPGSLDMIESQTVRAVIDYQMRVCIEQLYSFKPLIQSIASTLYQNEELEGFVVTDLFNSYVQSRRPGF